MIHMEYYLAKARQDELLRAAEAYRLGKQAGAHQKTTKMTLDAIGNFLRTIRITSKNSAHQARVSFES